MAMTYSVCSKCQKINKVDLNSAQIKKPLCGACGAELPFEDGISHLSGVQLQKIINKSPLPVVADFWAPWCGPCRSFSPTFSKVADTLKDQIVFIKVNTEMDPSASQHYGVRGIPTIALFKNGKEVDRQSGALPESHFRQWLLQNMR